MPPDELRNYLRRRPFVPFRIRLTDGQAFDIRNPELAMVGQRLVVIGIPEPRDTDPLPLIQSSVTVTLLHVVSVEPLEAATQAG